MTTAVRDKKLNRVKSSQTVNRSTKPVKDAPKADAVGLSVLLNAHLPRSFATPADVDAHIRALRDEWDDES